jgi:ubiquinol-cytochrome c reductase cytochrome b subunit
VVDRFALEQVRETALYRSVPKSPWYYGDGASLLLLFLVLVVTGALLGLTYSPAPENAHASVEYLTHQTRLGGFLRALHYWSAGLMVVVLYFHLFRQILLAGYKSPREGTWLTGVVLFALVISTSFIGYLLRWDQRAIYGVKVALEHLRLVPMIGDALVRLAQGGDELGPKTLSRIYALHVIILPLTIFGVVAFHLFLVVVHGVTTRSERKQPVHGAEHQRALYEAEAESPEHGEVFHPTTTSRSGLFALTVFALVVVLAISAGAPQLMPAAELVGASEPAEEWWFWWYSALIALLPPKVAPFVQLLLPLLFLLGLLALPFLDKSPHRGARGRPVWVAVVVLVVLSLLVLSDLRRRSPWTASLNAPPPAVPQELFLTDEAEHGRVLFSELGCTSCHAIAGQGPQIASDLGNLKRLHSPDELRRYILQPPEGVAMPGYRGRLSEEQLTQLVSFVLAAQTLRRAR